MSSVSSVLLDESAVCSVEPKKGYLVWLCSIAKWKLPQNPLRKVHFSAIARALSLSDVFSMVAATRQQIIIEVALVRIHASVVVIPTGGFSDMLFSLVINNVDTYQRKR